MGMTSLKGLAGMKAITAKAFILYILTALSTAATHAAIVSSNGEAGFRQIVTSHDAAPSIVAVRITPDQRILASWRLDSGGEGMPADERLFEIGAITKLFATILLADRVADITLVEWRRILLVYGSCPHLGPCSCAWAIPMPDIKG